MLSTGPPTEISGTDCLILSSKSIRLNSASTLFSIHRFDSKYEQLATFKKKKPAWMLKHMLTTNSEYTPTVTEEQQAEGVKRLKKYHDWFHEHVMPAAKDGYSSSIMVLPWTNCEPDYRDRYKDGPQTFTSQGFFFYNVGPYANSPELIFPSK